MKPLKLFATVVSQAVCLHSYFCFIHSAWAEQPHYDHRQPSFAIHAAAAARERFVELWFCFQQFLFAGQQCASESGLFTFRCLNFCVLSLSLFFSLWVGRSLPFAHSLYRHDNNIPLKRSANITTESRLKRRKTCNLFTASYAIYLRRKKTDWLMSSSSCLVVCPSPSLTSFT